MLERSKLESLRNVSITRIGDALSYGFLQTEYHKMLTSYHIEGERSCEFSSNIIQSHYSVTFVQQPFYIMPKIFHSHMQMLVSMD